MNKEEMCVNTLFAVEPEVTAAHELTKKIDRYGRFEGCRHYPQSDFVHGRIVGYGARHITALARDELGLKVDPKLAWAMGEIHDLPEGYPPFGDHQAAHKALMTKAELAALDVIELIAIEFALANMPKVYLGFPTADLFRRYRERKEFESQVVKLFDGIDVYGYNVHEIRSGNTGLLKYQFHRGHKLDPPVINYSKSYFQDLLAKLPLVQPLFERVPSPLLSLPRARSLGGWKAVARHGRPHTQASIAEAIWSQDDPLYSAWLRIILKSRDKACIDWLLNRSPTPA